MSEREGLDDVVLDRGESRRSLVSEQADAEASNSHARSQNQRRLIDGAAGFIRDMFQAPGSGVPLSEVQSEPSAADSARETLMAELQRDLQEGEAALESMHVKRKLRLRQQKVLTLEIRNNGETQYKQRTLRDLFLYVRKLISEIEQLAAFPEEELYASRSSKRSTRTSGQWLRARDLHKIESFASTEPTLMVRRHCVLLALEPLRGVVLWDRLIVLVPDGADSLLHVLETELQSHVNDADTYGSGMIDVRPASAPRKRRKSLPHKLSVPELRNTLPDGTTLYWSKDAESTLQRSRRKQRKSDGGPLRRVASEGKLRNESDDEASDSDGMPSDSTPSVSLGPFELRALEAILSTIVYLQNRAYEKLSTRTESVVGQLSRSLVVSADVQERLRLLKNATTGLSARMQGFLRAFDELLEDDEDLALMNLSKLHNKPTLYNLPLQPEIMNAHEEMELLFESYAQDFNTLSTNLKILQGHVTNAEELLLLRLDTARNQLLTAETIFTLVSMCFAIGSFVGSIFGMNLLNHREEEPHDFLIVTLITTGGIVLLGFGIFVFFRQRGLFVS